jgi:hypothetical protein
MVSVTDGDALASVISSVTVRLREPPVEMSALVCAVVRLAEGSQVKLDAIVPPRGAAGRLERLERLENFERAEELEVSSRACCRICRRPVYATTAANPWATSLQLVLLAHWTLLHPLEKARLWDGV